MRNSSMLTILAVVLLPLGLSAQAAKNLPHHALVAGVGVGPTDKDLSVHAGYAELISAKTGTYSYTGIDVIPSILRKANGSKLLMVSNPVVHTGLKQVVYQANRFTIVADASAGVSLPSEGATAYNFSAIAGGSFMYRLGKTEKTLPGESNNYLAFKPTFTQLTGTLGGSVVSLSISFIHGIN